MDYYNTKDPKVLDGLPDRSYVQEHDGFPVYKYGGLWYLAAPEASEGRSAQELEFPVRVLHVWGSGK